MPEECKVDEGAAAITILADLNAKIDEAIATTEATRAEQKVRFADAGFNEDGQTMRHATRVLDKIDGFLQAMGNVKALIAASQKPGEEAAPPAEQAAAA